jgi:uncharacterized protein YbjT (DUF2867 family)
VAGVNFKEAKAVIPGTGNEIIHITSREDIARFIAAILKHPEITAKANIRLGGQAATAHKLVALYENQLGKKFEVSYRPADEIDKVAQEGLKSGNLGAFFSNQIPLFTATGVSFSIRPR